mgnify:FL=1
MTKILFMGLGTMGYPMAGHLKKSGYKVTVYNRTESRAKKWAREFFGNYTNEPANEASFFDIVFACVGNDDDLKEVTSGEKGILKKMRKGAIFVDHTTASASVEKELFNISKDLQIKYLDAPVSGGEKGAQDGKLTIMCGGEKTAFNEVEGVMASYSQTCKLMGKIGSGQLTKMANQICIAGILQGLSEAINFSQRAGIDVDKMIEVISKGAAGSWQLENRGKTMAANKFDFGFAVDWMRKDLDICLREAESNGSPLPLVSLVDQFYKEVQLMGGGRWDTSSLIKRFENLN